MLTTTKKLRSIKPNIGIEVAYRKRLIRLIIEMNRSVQFYIEQTYRNNEPLIAQDEMPANILAAQIKRLTRRWKAQFNDMGPKLADHFATSVNKRSQDSLKRILKDGGFTVSKFKMTRAQQDIMRATINENVALIRSIPEKYFTDVEGMVMRSVSRGGDLGTLSKGLQKQYELTKKRAALIARDQNTKAMTNFTHARYDQVGITEAIWVHSSAGKEPRPSHVKAGAEGVRYDVKKGWFDPHEQQWILPGQLINCRCQSRPVVAGFDD